MKKQIQRIEWIDIYKGISIVLVVAGHVWGLGEKYIFWFHMPLFFFISGYLYNSDISIGNYCKKKFYHLLVPYFLFLFLLSIPDYLVCINSATQSMESSLLKNITSLTIKQIYGGRDLYGWFDVFWFVTCLFLTQQVFHLLNHLIKNKTKVILIIILCFYVYATIGQYLVFMRLPLFWGINIVPMAIVFFFFGNKIPDRIINNNKIVIGSTIVFILTIILDFNGMIHHVFKMKWEAYGIPIINIIIALCGIVIVSNTAKLFSHIKIIKTVFTELGKASLIIMFLHQAVKQLVFSRLFFINNELIIIVVTLIVCYCAYRVLLLSSVTRRFFLGEVIKE